MAKQHRMFILTVAAIAAFLLPRPEVMLVGTLWIITLGSALTCIIRTMRIAKLLKDQAK